MALHGLLARVRTLEVENERLVNVAADVLLHCVDSLCSRGQFDVVDDLILALDIDSFDTNLLVVLLGVTLSARHKLEQREVLVEQVERRLRELAPDRVEKLMEGLR